MHARLHPASPLLSPITSVSTSPSSPSPTRTTFTDVFSTSRTPSPSPDESATSTYPVISSVSSLPLFSTHIRPSSPPTNQPSDIPRLRTTHVTAGYRDGISSSKAAALQPGFDEGYPLGATLGLRVGYILGVLEGIVTAIRHASRSQANEKSGAKIAGVENLNGTRELEGLGKELKKMEKMMVNARTELCVEKVFGREVWGEDGVWKYDVEGEDGFEAVAKGHPVVKEWMLRVEEERRRWCEAGDIKGEAG